MKLWSIFCLRRPLRDLSRIAAALEEHNRILRAHWGIRDAARPAKPMEISSFDVAAANKSWREEQEALGISVEDDQ